MQYYLPGYDLYHSGYEENEFNIEWMHYGEKRTLPDVVADVYEAIKGREVIIEPNSPAEGIIVAFVLINDAPVEFIQFTDCDSAKKQR